MSKNSRKPKYRRAAVPRLDQRGKPATKKQKINKKILIAYLQAILFAHKNKIFTQLKNKCLHVVNEGELRRKSR